MAICRLPLLSATMFLTSNCGAKASKTSPLSSCSAPSGVGYNPRLMPIEAGTRLEHYEVTGSLGAGGMGEVYRARDTKLKRDVALKILPGQFANDAERLARFEREAQALAAINHPHIAAIYGLEHTDGMRFLVLELVEGPTLAERLNAGRMEVPEALRIATEIAEAMEASHEKGVIHRDLKPANVKLTSGGQVKVLDFGLAKAFGESQPTSDLANSPTMMTRETQAGVIFGTAASLRRAKFGRSIPTSPSKIGRPLC